MASSLCFLPQIHSTPSPCASYSPCMPPPQSLADPCFPLRLPRKKTADVCLSRALAGWLPVGSGQQATPADQIILAGSGSSCLPGQPQPCLS